MKGTLLQIDNMKKIIPFLGITSIAYGQDAFFSNFYRSYALSNPSAIIMQDDINITTTPQSMVRHSQSIYQFSN